MYSPEEWTDLKRRHQELERCQVCGAPATIAGTLCGPCSRWAYLAELAQYDRIAARQGRLMENRRRKARHAMLDAIAR
jgi:hypothetical protein